MDIKDNIARMYIKGFVIPKAQIFDKPGFITFRISGKTNVFARQVLVPETLFVELERSIVEKYGELGKSALYSIGKKFGYSFSQLGRFENIKDHPGNGIKDWIIIASKFIEGTYASEISQTIDVENSTVDFLARNFVVCRKLGYDFLFASGGAAGVVAWLLQDKSIESYYYDGKYLDAVYVCRVKCAPIARLERSFKGIYKEIDLDRLDQDIKMYSGFNAESEIQYKKSFSDFLDAKIFSYDNGIINLNSSNERFFLTEVSGLYLLELGLKNNKLDSDVFDVAYSVGSKLFDKLNVNIKSLLELITALGWGETCVVPSQKDRVIVIINHFPWTLWYKDIDFLVIRGLLSGLLSKIYGRELKLNKPDVDIHNKYLALVFKES